MTLEDIIIKIEDVSFAYEVEGDADGELIITEALKNVNVDIERGSFVAIIGPNGSGKSTLAKQLNALLVPSEGKILVENMDTATTNPVIIRSLVGMVFQNPDNQLVSSVVEDDVAFGPENLGVDPAEIRRRVNEALKQVSMYEHRKKGPHLLSGGQKQRIAIAGVLAMRPECIVFDEPTAMLDPSGKVEIMQIIKELHEEGKTVVLITHFMEEAAQADRILVMRKGRLEIDDTPVNIFKGDNVRKLREFHLELPFAVELAEALRNRGIAIPEDIITVEALADYLCELK
jgi:energy-coupling factor transport system ATP-binding protein